MRKCRCNFEQKVERRKQTHEGAAKESLDRVVILKGDQNTAHRYVTENFISVIVLCGIVKILLSVTGPLNLMLGTSTDFMTMLLYT